MPIERLIGRLRMLHFVRLIVQLAFLSAGVILVFSLASAIAEKYLWKYWWAAAWLPTAAALFLGTRAVASFFSDKRSKLAQELDSRNRLKDRLTTYVQLRDSKHPFLAPLIEETEARLNGATAMDPASLRRGSGGPLLFAVIPALLLAVLPFLPVPESLAERIDQHRRIVQEARKLQTEAQKLEKEAEKLPGLKPFVAELDQLARDLQKPSVDPAEALKKMNSAQDRLKDAGKEVEKSQREGLSKNLDRLSREGGTSGDLSESERKQMQEAARELEKALADQNLEGGKEAMEALKSGQVSPEQMEKMKQALEKYKNEQAETQKRMAELQQSMENAKKGAASGKKCVVYNSKIDDRKVDTGKSGVDDGPGTTNKDAGPSKFDTRKQGKGQYAEDRTRADYEQLYKGQRENAGSDPLFLNGQWDPENARFTRIRTFGVDSESGSSGNGSQETVVQSDAESVIRKEQIPASYRNLVKKYFETVKEMPDSD